LHIPRGAVEFDHVYFRYDSRGPNVIRDLSFKVEPGRKLAILGVSGAGKTTIFNLLMRLADPSSGRVLIDGHDLRDIVLESYLKHTGVVLQDNFLFSASIRDNILFGDGHASEQRLADAIDRAGLWPTVRALPDGLDTVLLEGGNLSMGQKQRIAIARAVIRNPRFLFLDEATAALDPITEEEILAQLAEIEEGRTRIVISHHVSSVKDADEILVMESGACVQRGKHDDLMNTEGPYRNLWAAEAEKHVEIVNGVI
jgi:ATP-binding cassette subfamily B protein